VLIEQVKSKTKTKRTLNGSNPEFSSEGLFEKGKQNGLPKGQTREQSSVRNSEAEAVPIKGPKHIERSVVDRMRTSKNVSDPGTRFKTPPMFGRSRIGPIRETKRQPKPKKPDPVVQRVVRSSFDRLVPQPPSSTLDPQARPTNGSVADEIFGPAPETPEAPPSVHPSPAPDEIESPRNITDEPVQNPFGSPVGAMSELEEIEDAMTQAMILDSVVVEEIEDAITQATILDSLNDNVPQMMTSEVNQEYEELQDIEPPSEAPIQEPMLDPPSPASPLKSPSPNPREMSLEWESRGAGPSNLANYFVNLGPSGRESRPRMKNIAMAKAQMLNANSSRAQGSSVSITDKPNGDSSLRSDEDIENDSLRRRSSANLNISNFVRGRKRKRRMTSDEEDPEYMGSAVKKRKSTGKSLREEQQQQQDDQELFNNLDNLVKVIRKKDEPSKDPETMGSVEEPKSLQPEPEVQEELGNSPREALSSPSSPPGDRTESERDELEGEDEMSDYPDGSNWEDNRMDEQFESARDRAISSNERPSSAVGPPDNAPQLNGFDTNVEEPFVAGDDVPVEQPGSMVQTTEARQPPGTPVVHIADTPGRSSPRTFSHASFTPTPTPKPASSVPPSSFTLPYAINWEERERKALLHEFRDVLQHHPEFTGGYRRPGISPGYASWQVSNALKSYKALILIS
jgi:hypothetical protein